MKSKKISFEFWKVKTPDSFPGGFGAALIALQGISNISQRNKNISDYTMRWEELELDGRYFYGDFFKLRMDLLPLRGGINRKSSSLNLPLNEGISEPFVFIYDKNSNILVTQHNHYGASVGSFTQYIQQLVPIGGLIDVLPVYSVAGLQRLRHMTDVRRVCYRIAKPRNNALNPGAQGSVDSSISTMNDFDGENIEVIISSGRARRSLTIREVLRRASDLLTGKTIPEANLEKFEVSGYSNGDRDEFDLVKEQLRAKIPVMVGSDRGFTYDDRKAAAMKALNKRRSELVTQFGQQCL